MPTAIISDYRGDGFVVAADGMAKGSTPTLDRRKIFQFGDNKWLAYAFAGRVAIGPDEGVEFSFDFRDTIEEAVQARCVDGYATLREYATDLADHAHRVLVEKCSGDEITFDGTTELGAPFAYVFISGYLKQVASNVIVQFSRENRQYAKPDVSAPKPVLGFPLRHGSILIDHIFTVESSPFRSLFFNEKYFRPLEVPLPHLSKPMVNAVIDSRAYIEACASAKGRELDPEACPNIGGHIHMASITPTEGFDWVPGFKPKPKGIE